MGLVRRCMVACRVTALQLRVMQDSNLHYLGTSYDARFTTFRSRVGRSLKLPTLEGLQTPQTATAFSEIYRTEVA